MKIEKKKIGIWISLAIIIGGNMQGMYRLCSFCGKITLFGSSSEQNNSAKSAMQMSSKPLCFSIQMKLEIRLPGAVSVFVRAVSSICNVLRIVCSAVVKTYRGCENYSYCLLPFSFSKSPNFDINFKYF